MNPEINVYDFGNKIIEMNNFTLLVHQVFALSVSNQTINFHSSSKWFHWFFLCSALHGILYEINGFSAFKLLTSWCEHGNYVSNWIVSLSRLCANKFSRPFCMSKRQLCGQSGVYVCIRLSSSVLSLVLYMPNTCTHAPTHNYTVYRWVHMCWKWIE